MAMTFYNPASLLSSPEAAVKPLPASNTAAFAIGSAMESIRAYIGKKQQVDSLKSDTEALASYMDNRSPDLAELLRTKIDNYKPTAFTGYDAIDVDKEKSSLLKGVIELYGKELESNKVDASGNSVTMQNNWANKLRASESELSNLRNNFNTWERNEDTRIQNETNAYTDLAHKGKADGITKPVRKDNPYASKVTEAETRNNSLITSGPEEIRGMQTPGKISYRGGRSSIPLPSNGIITPMTSSEKKADQNRAVDEEGPMPTPDTLHKRPSDYGGFLDTTPPTKEDQSSVLFPQSPGHAAATQSTEIPDPPRPAKDSPMPELTPAQRQAAMTGANEGVVGGEITPPTVASAPVSNDPIQRINEVAKQKMAGNVKAVTGSLDQLINGIKRDKGTYIDKNTAEQAVAEGQAVREDILSLPDPGSDEWMKASRMLLSAYRSSTAMLQRNSASGEKKEQQVASQEQLQYYVKDSVSKDPITVYKRIQDGQPRFYVLEDGKETEVTNRIGVDFLPVTSTTPTAPAANGGKIKTLGDLLK